MANEIVSELRLVLDQYKKDLKEAQAAGEKAGKESSEAFGNQVERGLSRSLGGLKSMLAAAAGALAGAFTLKESIQAAMEQESAINSLNSALALSGNYSAQASADFQEFAASLQATTTAADEVIVQGGALLASLGKLSGQGLKDATAASLDLAAALNVDVNTAFSLMSKAAAGNVGALGRYGIQIKDTGDNAKDFANALKLVEERFGGMAKLQSGTFAGAMAQTKNAFGEVLEEIGNLIIKSPTMITFLNVTKDAFLAAAKAISGFGVGRDVVQEMTLALVALGRTTVTYLIVPLEFAYNTVKTVFQGIAFVIQSVLATVVSLSAKINGVIGLVVPGFSEASEALKVIAEDMNATAVTMAEDTAESAGKIFDFGLSERADEILTGVEEFAAAVTPVVQDRFKGIGTAAKQGVTEGMAGITFGAVAAAMQDSANKIKITAADLAKQLNQSFVNGISNSFAALGGALAKGENAFQAFGKAILGALGDILIQFGSMLIAVGIGLSSVPFLFGLQGPAAIAAGTAALILGGALKALSGGSGGAGAPAPGPGAGGGVAAGGGTGAAPGADVGQGFQENLRGEVGTAVTVNVQGNVLDRRQTGLELAEVINEAVGSGGVVFAQGGA